MVFYPTLLQDTISSFHSASNSEFHHIFHLSTYHHTIGITQEGQGRYLSTEKTPWKEKSRGIGKKKESRQGGESTNQGSWLETSVTKKLEAGNEASISVPIEGMLRPIHNISITIFHSLATLLSSLLSPLFLFLSLSLSKLALHLFPTFSPFPSY